MGKSEIVPFKSNHLIRLGGGGVSPLHTTAIAGPVGWFMVLTGTTSLSAGIGAGFPIESDGGYRDH